MSGWVFSIKNGINRQKVGNFSIRIKANSIIYIELAFCLCDPVGIRTQDPQLRRLLLYPAELPDRTFIFAYFAMEAKVGAKIVIFI